VQRLLSEQWSRASDSTSVALCPLGNLIANFAEVVATSGLTGVEDNLLFDYRMN
jgi:hypothetical protein